MTDNTNIVQLADPDTIAACRALLADAEAGRINGLVYGAMSTVRQGRRTWDSGIVGRARKDTTEALGMVIFVEEELRALHFTKHQGRR